MANTNEMPNGDAVDKKAAKKAAKLAKKEEKAASREEKRRKKLEKAPLFCCLPFGIVGIVYASQVSSSYSAGDYAKAKLSSQKAGKWTKASFFVGLLIGLLYFVFVVLFGVGASMM